MKPIAQTFLVSQPNTGIDGVFLSKIDVYFKTVSTSFGIRMEIRTVENGFPTSNRVAGGEAFVSAVNAASSQDSSVATTFTFVTPPFLQSNVQYAFVLVPDGGNDDYEIWTGELGSVDALTNSPIYTNNQLGNLFISSNDLVFTPITTESIKHSIYIAQFSTSQANVFYNIVTSEFLNVNDVVGSFLPNETVMASNSVFTTGATTAASNTVTVANSAVADLANNNLIFLSTPDRSSISICRVVSAVNSTAITVNPAPTFSNTTSWYGRVHGDGALRGMMGDQVRYSQYEDYEYTVKRSTANSSLNFSGSANSFLIGVSSRASATIKKVCNKPYDSVTPVLNIITPKETNSAISFSGVANDTNFTADVSFQTATAGLPKEFTDIERMLLSRSKEYTALPVGRQGSRTSTIQAVLQTSNNITAPYIDNLGTAVVYTYNPPTSELQLSGVYLNTSNTNGVFSTGETVSQSSVTGVVDYANSTFLRVISTNGTFVANSTTLVGGTSAANTLIGTVTSYDETKTNGYYKASRYISKKVVLADKQDAEDLVCYLTANRPVGTNFKVYGKFLSGTDTDTFDAKDWSLLTESDLSIALFSSPVNRDDLVELQFHLPASAVVDTSGVGTSTAANTVTVGDTSFYTVNSYVYITDSGQFNVRKVTGIVNNSTLQLSSNPSFTAASAVAGRIDGLASQTGAFQYTANNSIVRYATTSDAFFDTYKTFSVKIVPVTNNSILVPTMKDMRCLALQV
jgi:hypothetical protein